MHADDISDLEDFGMILQLLTEDCAADLLVGLIGDLQAGAEVCGKKTVIRSTIDKRLVQEGNTRNEKSSARV